MKRKSCRVMLGALGLSALLCGSGWIAVSTAASGSSQSKKPLAIELPKARQSTEGAEVETGSFIVSVPAEGGFYVGGKQLTKEILAAAIRDALYDRPPDEQTVYLKCSASLKFGAVRQ